MIDRFKVLTAKLHESTSQLTDSLESLQKNLPKSSDRVDSAIGRQLTILDKLIPALEYVQGSQQILDQALAEGGMPPLEALLRDPTLVPQTVIYDPKYLTPKGGSLYISTPIEVIGSDDELEHTLIHLKFEPKGSINEYTTTLLINAEEIESAEFENNLMENNLQLTDRESAEKICNAAVEFVKSQVDQTQTPLINLTYTPRRVRKAIQKNFNPSGEAFSKLLYALKSDAVRTSDGRISLDRTKASLGLNDQENPGLIKHAFVEPATNGSLTVFS